MRIVPLAFILLCAECLAQNGLIYSHIFPSVGSPSDAAITAMATDAAGNVYLTGWTEGAGLPTTPGVVQPDFNGATCSNGESNPFTSPQIFICPESFIIKLDAHGKIVFATYLGGSGFTQPTSVGLDAAGNIYVAGIDAVHPTFIVKLNSSATAILYTATIPGTGAVPFMMPNGSNVPPSRVSMSVAVDSVGDVYFAAKGTSGFPVTANAIQTSGGIAIGKLDPAGKNLLYATYLGGSGDSPGGMTIDASGNLYITGSTSSTDFPVTKGVLESTLATGASTAFAAKLNPSGNALAYATYLGGSSGAAGQVIHVDSSGNAYVLGQSNSGFPVTAGAYQNAFNASSSFLAKLNPDASALVYATYVSANATPSPSLLDVDAAGDAYISGPAWAGLKTSPDALQPCIAGGVNAFVLQLSPKGSFAAATYLGGSGENIAYALHADPDGTVLLAGLALSSDFFVSQDSALHPPGDFVTKFKITEASNANLPCSILAPVNEATFQGGPVAPGELVTFWGLRFGPDDGAHQQLDSSGRVATELAGVRVFFDQYPAPILYAQSLQINAQAPWELAGQTSAQVHVEYNGVSTRNGVVSLEPSAPALFPVIINHDGTRNSAGNPAPAGSVVSIFGTGGGATNPASLSGGFSAAAPLAHLELPASVLIDGTLGAEVVYAGVSPASISGVFQINFRVPPSLAAFATHRVDVIIGNESTEGRISITVATN